MENVLRRKRNSMLVTMAAVAGLSAVVLSLIGQNYPLFHTLIELMVAVVALAVFMIAWHTRAISSSDYITFIGMAALPIGVVTLLHALAYKGMPVFPGYDANLPTQLWVIARTVQASAFLIAPLFLVRPLKRPGLALAIYSVCTAIAVWAAFAGYFPAAFVEGQGLTSFKVNMEFAVILMTAVGAAGLYVNRAGISRDVAVLLWISMGCTIVAELAFTLYADPFGPANRIGHAAHFAAFLLIYAALVQESLERPVETLFHELKQREGELAAAYAVEHEIAETLQDAMAIQPEGVPGLRLAHRYRPAPGKGRIGGDFYDLFPVGGGLVGFAIGDVCGKGLKAAMTTMQSRSALRAVALDDSEPSRVLERLNAYLRRELKTDSFVTALFGTIEPDTGHVRIAVAGHPEPMVCGHPEIALPEDFRAPPLGVVAQLGVRTWEIDLSAGESIVLVTDGVLEAGRADMQFGQEGLLRVIHSTQCTPNPDDVVDSIIDAIDEHTGRNLNDDVAVVVIQRLNDPGKPLT